METADGGPSDITKAAREAGIYAYSRFAASLLGLVVLVVGTEIYSKPDFAFLGAIILLYEGAMALGSLGLADAVFYFIGREPGRGPHIVRQTSLLLLSVAIPVIAGTMLAGWVMSRPTLGGHILGEPSLDLVPVLPWLALLLVLELPTQPAVNQLIASGRASLASGLYIGFSLLRMAAALLPGLIGIGIEWVPIIMALAAVTRLMTHVAIVRRFFPLPAGDGRASWLQRRQLRDVMLFAIPAGAAMIAGRLNPQIDKYVAGVLLGEDALAEYTAAAYELPLITLVPYAVSAVLQSRYVRLYQRGDLTGLAALWHASVRKTMLLVLPLTVMVIALGHEAIVVMTEPAYADAALPFRIFTAVILYRVAAYNAMLQAIGQSRAVIVASALLLGTNLVLSYPLTRLFGYPGPALAVACAAIPSWLYTLSRIGGVFGGGIRAALPWRRYAQVLSLALAVGLAVWLVAAALPLGPGARLALGAAAYIALFVPLGRASGLIVRDDLRFLGRWLSLRTLRER